MHLKSLLNIKRDYHIKDYNHIFEKEKFAVDENRKCIFCPFFHAFAEIRTFMR